MQNHGEKTILMVAGEASGDLHGARVVHELKKETAKLRIYGIGGKAMRAAGVRILIASDQLAVVGITEVFAKLRVLLKAIRKLKAFIKEKRPDLLILIDFPDFNLYLASVAKRCNIPVLYYISPQIWAWRKTRINKIKARVDHMAVILPFEKDIYAGHGIPVSFVGHPLLDSATERTHDITRFADGAPPVIGLLPGSRDKEVARLLPVMLDAAKRLSTQFEKCRFIVSCAPTMEIEAIKKWTNRHADLSLELSTAPVINLFETCTLIVAASGTATLEAAIYGIPTIITYIVSPLSFLMGKLFVKVEYIGLANLIAQRQIMPELIQNNMNADTLTRTVGKLLTDRRRYASTCQALRDIKHQLGMAGAALRVARIALKMMGLPHVV